MHIKWSSEDESFIGYCPGLIHGGACHGDNIEETWNKLSEVVLDVVADFVKDPEFDDLNALKEDDENV